MMARFPDPHRELGRALIALGAEEIIESHETAWASATFSGARHHFLLTLAPARDLAEFLLLDEHEFDLPGHIVADIALTTRDEGPAGCRLTVEALTVEDA